jgi:hypothetical protein
MAEPNQSPDAAPTPEPPKPASTARSPDAPATIGELERALKTVYRLYGEARYAQTEVAAMVKAVVESLAAGGVLPLREYERRRQRALDAFTNQLAERHNIHMDSTPDKYALTDLPQIDCASIMPICQARCCTLRVCLSQQDVDEGILSWDYQRPYQIRRRDEEGNYCVYSEQGSHRCMVYAHRPAVCRTYDCRKDPRIWKDFERRILAD